jgi:hypothetical protein
MSELKKVQYTAKAHTTGGRDGGASRSSAGRLDIKLSLAPARAPIPSSCLLLGGRAMTRAVSQGAVAEIEVTGKPNFEIFKPENALTNK